MGLMACLGLIHNGNKKCQHQQRNCLKEGEYLVKGFLKVIFLGDLKKIEISVILVGALDLQPWCF